MPLTLDAALLCSSRAGSDLGLVYRLVKELYEVAESTMLPKGQI